MPSLPLRVYTLCNARNAYSPAIAIASAIGLSSCHSNVLESNPLGFQRTLDVPRSLPRHLQASKRCIATTTRSRAPPLANDDVQAILERDRQRLGLGGTYASYETLKRSMGQRSDVVDPSESRSSGAFKKIRGMRGRNNDSRGQHRSETFSAGTNQGANQRPSRQGQNATKSVLDTKPTTVDSRHWQIRMREIADIISSLLYSNPEQSDAETIKEAREALDYHGCYIEPTKTPMDRAIPIPWALTSQEASGLKADQLLEQEIHRFVKHIEPTLAERAAREAVISDVRTVISKHLGKSLVTTEVFGSESTGLILPTSDIDIRLVSTTGHRAFNEQVRSLADAMNQSLDYICVVYRFNRYPIISAQHKHSGIDIQIVSAPPSTRQQEVTKQYLAELPHLRSLYLLLRTALGMRGLIDVFVGGIGSYGLLIMLAASLKRRSSQPETTLSGQLHRFLDFYTSLDTTNHGVSATSRGLFKKHAPGDFPFRQYVGAAARRGDRVRAGQWVMAQQRVYQPYLLCLQDPARLTNDLGRKSLAIKHITATLQEMKLNIERDVQVAADAAVQGAMGRAYSALLRFVGPCHEVYYERRRKVEEYGLRVMAERGVMGGMETKVEDQSTMRTSI